MSVELSLLGKVAQIATAAMLAKDGALTDVSKHYTDITVDSNTGNVLSLTPGQLSEIYEKETTGVIPEKDYCNKSKYSCHFIEDPNNPGQVMLIVMNDRGNGIDHTASMYIADKILKATETEIKIWNIMQALQVKGGYSVIVSDKGVGSWQVVLDTKPYDDTNETLTIPFKDFKTILAETFPNESSISETPINNDQELIVLNTNRSSNNNPAIESVDKKPSGIQNEHGDNNRVTTPPEFTEQQIENLPYTLVCLSIPVFIAMIALARQIPEHQKPKNKTEDGYTPDDVLSYGDSSTAEAQLVREAYFAQQGLMKHEDPNDIIKITLGIRAYISSMSRHTTQPSGFKKPHSRLHNIFMPRTRGTLTEKNLEYLRRYYEWSDETNASIVRQITSAIYGEKDPDVIYAKLGILDTRLRNIHGFGITQDHVKTAESICKSRADGPITQEVFNTNMLLPKRQVALPNQRQVEKSKLERRKHLPKTK